MGLQENIRNEPVGNLSLRKAITVDPDMPVFRAIARMRNKRLGCVIVVDEHGHPVGTFTELALIHLLRENPQGLKDRVGNHMDRVWACVKESDRIADMLDVMHQKQLRFVVVTDDTGKAVALGGQRGIMEYVAEHFPGQVMVQRVGAREFTQEREGA